MSFVWRGEVVRRTVQAKSRFSFFLVVATMVLVFMIGVLVDIELPGVYMDTVNPDYLVVSILHPSRPIEAWVLPGNYIAHRLPILTSPYHGTEQVWLGLPFFALLGTSVWALRLVHGAFACAILVALACWLRRARLNNPLIAAAGVALAVDPSFVFAFRTQSYITTAPTAWLLLSWAALDIAAEHENWRKWILLSGVAYGLALFGYFIYLFYLPALLIAVYAWPDRAGQGGGFSARWGRIWPWLRGVCLGAVLYPIGYALVVLRFKSVAGALEYVQELRQSLGVFKSELDLPGRLAYSWQMVEAVTHNWWHNSAMLGQWTPVPYAPLKTLLLTAAPIMLWIVAESRRTSDRYLRVTIASGVSFFLCSLIFGSRLGGHHYVSLLILGYVALALGLAAAMRPNGATITSTWRAAWALPAFMVLFLIGLEGQYETRLRLRETGGVGLFSDALDHFAADALAEHREDFYYLPDWGLMTSFAFLTTGQVEYSAIPNYGQARYYLCHGRNVHVAFINGDRAQRAAQWAREIDWQAPAMTAYRQRDGVTVFELASFRAASPGALRASCSQ